MLTKERRYTSDEWKRLEPLFKNWSEKQKAACRLILVEGETAAEAGRQTDMSRQQAHIAALRAHERIDKYSEEGRLPLTAWVKRSDYEAIAALLRSHGCIVGGDDMVEDGER